MADTPTWPVAAGSLILGFAVAQVTGVRAIGGIVLAIALIWCGLRWFAARGPGVTAGLVVFYLLMFAASHGLALGLGFPDWPSVFLVAAIDAAVTWALADRVRSASAGATAERPGIGVSARSGR